MLLSPSSFPSLWACPAFLSCCLSSSSRALCGIHRARQLQFPRRPAEDGAAPPAGPQSCARASCEVRWEEAAWEPRGVDAAEARSRTCRWVSRPGEWGSGGASCLTAGLVSELGSEAALAAPPPQSPRLLLPREHPPQSVGSGAPRAGRAHSPPSGGGMTKHKGTEEDHDPLGLLQGQQASKRGPVRLRLQATREWGS